MYTEIYLLHLWYEYIHIHIWILYCRQLCLSFKEVVLELEYWDTCNNFSSQFLWDDGLKIHPMPQFRLMVISLLTALTLWYLFKSLNNSKVLIISFVAIMEPSPRLLNLGRTFSCFWNKIFKDLKYFYSWTHNAAIIAQTLTIPQLVSEHAGIHYGPTNLF